MSELRSLIRQILAEEIAGLAAGGVPAGPQVEWADVGGEQALTAFALSVVDRARDPAFVAALREGRLRFAPGDGAPARPVPARAAPLHAVSPRAMPAAAPVTLVTTMPAPVPELRKRLVTERDIAAIPGGEVRLRIGKDARLTPLAGDEARRRGIRIERTLA